MRPELVRQMPQALIEVTKTFPCCKEHGAEIRKLLDETFGDLPVPERIKPLLLGIAQAMLRSTSFGLSSGILLDVNRAARVASNAIDSMWVAAVAAALIYEEEIVFTPRTPEASHE